jgi:hypothetical protein
VQLALGDNLAHPKSLEVIKAGFYPIQNGIFMSIDQVF